MLQQEEDLHNSQRQKLEDEIKFLNASFSEKINLLQNQLKESEELYQ